MTADLNDTELPREISSLASAYTIHGLGEFTEYEISVLIDSVDFGQSEWSDSVIIKTKEKSESDFNELDQLKTQIVRFFIYKTYQGMNIQISFMWHILVKNPVSNFWAMTSGKVVFSKMVRKIDKKSSHSIWHLLHNVKSTVRISSIFVPFLENMNFNLAFL